VSGPSDTIFQEGGDVQLSCCSNLLVPVKWTRVIFESIDFQVIYEGVIVDKFLPRFGVSNGPDGFQNLTIKNILLIDAGKYTCIDNGGFGVADGQFASAELTVCGRSHRFKSMYSTYTIITH